LKEDGIEFFLDEISIELGENIMTTIREALERTRVLIFLMSATSQHAEWPKFELETIWFNNITNSPKGMVRFIPLRLDASKLSMTLQPYKYLNWKTPEERKVNYPLLKKAIELQRSSTPST